MKKIGRIGIVLLVCGLLTGCGEKRILTEAGMKREARKELKEKYGEEFVIHDAWGLSYGTFCVACSPKDDSEVVFEAEFYSDGEMYKDEYVQGVVAKRLNEKYLAEFQEFFADCYVWSFVEYTKTDFENVKEVSIEDYMSQYEREDAFSFWSMYVFVPLSQVSDESIDAEYQLYTKEIYEEIIAGNLPNMVICLYFVDEEKMQWCKEYFSTNSHGYSKFIHAVEECPNIGFGYSDNTISLSYEEYKEFRQGLKEDK